MCSHVEGSNYSAAKKNVWQMEGVSGKHEHSQHRLPGTAANSAHDPAVRRDNPSQLAELIES